VEFVGDVPFLQPGPGLLDGAAIGDAVEFHGKLAREKNAPF
jgi:hypothetical protein